MAIIRKDKYGLVVQAGGHQSRPVQPSKFKKGDDVQTYHFGGTIKAGVGKNNICKKGEYLETWCTTGNDDYRTIIWYKVEFVNEYWELCSKAVVSTREQKIHDNYFSFYNLFIRPKIQLIKTKIL